MLRRVLGLLCAGTAGLVLAVAAFGDRPPGKPPCKGHAPCATTSTVTTTVSSTTTVADTTTVASTTTVGNTTTVSSTTTVSTTVPGARAPAPSSGSTPPTLADVSVAVTAPVGEVFASDDVAYTVVVSNTGPAVATGVHLAVVPAGSRLLASVSGSLGTLAPGSSATTEVRLIPDAAGAMSATFTASADEPDPSPANNVAFVSTNVLSGHAGPPGLHLPGQGPFAPPLVAVRGGGGWVVNSRVYVDEPATVLLSVVDRSGREQTMLPGTLVGYLPANRPHASIPHVLAAASWLPLHIKIGGAAARSYRILVSATGPDGSVSSTTIGFRTP